MPSRKKGRGRQRKARQRNVRVDAEEASQRDRELDDPFPQTQQSMPGPLKEDGYRIGDQDGTIFRHPSLNRHADGWNLEDTKLSSDDELQERAEDVVSNFAPELRRGNFYWTLFILRLLTEPRLGPKLRDVIVREDVHLSVIRFLSQCDKSLPDVLGKGCDVESIKLPGIWTEILRLIVKIDGCSNHTHLTLAKGIKPYVMCVMDGKRELFRRNGIWHMCLSTFFNMVYHIMRSKEGLKTMISYEGFIPFVAQASCWGQSREDIIMESHTFPIYFACTEALRVISFTTEVIDLNGDILQDLSEERQGEASLNPLNQIACTPLSSNNAECTDSTMVGLVRLMNCLQKKHKKLWQCMFVPLLLEQGYVDECVIVELIKCASNPSTIAIAAMDAILGLSEKYNYVKKCDSRYAAAIRHGFLELLINTLIERSDQGLAKELIKFALGMHSISMHSKTSRALRRRKMKILPAFHALCKSSAPQSDAICNLLGMSLESDTVVCCNCLKQFDRKNLRFCKRCKIECYCSIACQSESYNHGHDKFCKLIADQFDSLREKGVKEYELKRLEVLCSNLMITGCRFIKFSSAKLSDRLAVEEQSYKKTVVVDFRRCPPAPKLVSSSDFDQPGSLNCQFISQVFYESTKHHLAEVVILDKSIPIGSLALNGSDKKT